MGFLVKTTNKYDNGFIAALSQCIFKKIKYPEWSKWESSPIYQDLLKNYQAYYNNHNMTYNDIARLQKPLSHPCDQQIVLAYPLYLTLKNHLKSNNAFKDDSYHLFLNALRAYLNDKGLTPEEMSVAQSNLDFFKQTKIKYLGAVIACTRAKTTKPTTDNFLDLKKLRHHWDKSGFLSYYKKIFEAKNTINTIPEVAFKAIGQAFNIDITILQADQKTTTVSKLDNKINTLSVSKQHDHWHLVEPNQSIGLQHHTIWHYGIPILYPLKEQELRKHFDGLPNYQSKHTKHINSLYQTAVEKDDYAEIIRLVKLHHHDSLMRGSAFELIDKKIATQNIPILLAFYSASVEAQNYIIAQTSHHPKLLNKIIYYHDLYIKSKPEAQWAQAIGEVPIYDCTEGDKRLNTLIRQGNDKEAINAINQGYFWDFKNKYHVTPLHLACLYGRTKIIEAIFKKHAANLSKLSWWNYLTSKNIEFDLADKRGQTPMHYVASTPHLETLNCIYNNREHIRFALAIPELKDNLGRTPVHIAASNPKSGILKKLLSDITHSRFNASVCSETDKKGLFAIHYATNLGLRDNIKLLKEKGFTTKPNRNHYIALDKAVIKKDVAAITVALDNGDLDTAQLLTSSYSDLFINSSQGESFLNLAARAGRIDLIKQWYKDYSSINFCDNKAKNSVNPIQEAANSGHLEIVKFLKEKGQCFHAKDHFGNTILHYAAAAGQTNIVEYICQEARKDKAFYNSLTADTYNDIDYYAGRVLQGLISLSDKTEIDARNDFYESPYMLAMLNDHKQIMAILQKNGANTQHIFEYVFDALNIPIHEKGKQSTLAKLSYTEKLSIISKINSGHNDTLIKFRDKLGNTLLHYCARQNHYQLLQILLHPLNTAQRQAICGVKNNRNKTALDLITAQLDSTPKPQAKTVLEKMKRFLLPYHPTLYNKQSAVEKGIFQTYYHSDRKEDIKQSNGYWYTSSALLYGKPMYQGARILWTTGNPAKAAWYGFSALIGNDPIYTMERSFSLMKSKFNWSSDNNFVWALENSFTYYGWYHHTLMRASIFAAQALVVNSSDFLSNDPNYQTYINQLGVFMAISEELARQNCHKLSEYLPDYFVSLDATLADHLNIPTTKQVFNGAKKTAEQILEKANQYLSNQIDFDVLQLFKDANDMTWQKLGFENKQHVFETTVASQIKEASQGKTDDEIAKYIEIANLLFNNNYDYNSTNSWSSKFDTFLFYLNSGVPIPKMEALFNEISILLQENGQNPAEFLSDMISKTPIYDQVGFTSEQIEAIKCTIEQEINNITSVNDVKRYHQFEAIFQTQHNIISEQYIQHFLKEIIYPEMAANDDVRVFLETATDEIYHNNSDNFTNLFLTLKPLISMLANGAFSEEVLSIINQSASEGQTAQLLTDMYINSITYQLFGFNDEKKAEHTQTLLKSVQDSPSNANDIAAAFATANETIISDYFDNVVFSNYPSLNGEAASVIKQAGSMVIQAHIHNANEVQQKLHDLNDLIASPTLDDHDISLIHEMATMLSEQTDDNKTDDNKTYADYVTELSMASGPIRLLADKAQQNACQQRIQEKLADVNDLSPNEQIAFLSDILSAENQFLIEYYVTSRKPVQESMNDLYNNISNGIINVKAEDGCAEHLAWALIQQNPWTFGAYTADELQAAANYFTRTIQTMIAQSGNPDKFESIASEHYNRLQSMLLAPLYVQDYLARKPLTQPIFQVLEAYKPENNVAAAAVAMLNYYLHASSGYHGLDISQQLILFQKIVDEHYVDNNDTKINGIHNIIVEAIQKATQTTGQFGKINGEWTVDQAATFITQQSQLLAEHKWSEQHQFPTLDIGTMGSGKVHTFFKSVEKEFIRPIANMATSGQIGVGGSTNGNSLSIGATLHGELTNVAFQLFNKNKQPNIYQERTDSEHPQSKSVFAGDPAKQSVVFKRDNITIADPFLAKPFQNSIGAHEHEAFESTMNQYFPANPEKRWLEYWIASNKAYAQENKAQQTQANQTPHKGPLDHLKPLNQSNHFQSTLPTNQGLGEKILSAIIPPAHGIVPLAIAIPIVEGLAAFSSSELAIMSAMGLTGTALIAHHSKIPSDENQTTLYTFPILTIRDFILWGTNPNLKPDNIDKFIFNDGGVSLLDKYITAKENDSNLNNTTYTFPLQVNSGLYLYRKTKVILDQKERNGVQEYGQKYIPAAKTLPGFPKAKKTAPKTPYGGGSKRKRWELPKGQILEWDYQHGELEMYSKNGDHLGSYNHLTGEKVKEPVKSRNIKKFL